MAIGLVTDTCVFCGHLITLVGHLVGKDGQGEISLLLFHIKDHNILKMFLPPIGVDAKPTDGHGVSFEVRKKIQAALCLSHRNIDYFENVAKEMQA